MHCVLYVTPTTLSYCFKCVLLDNFEETGIFFTKQKGKLVFVLNKSAKSDLKFKELIKDLK